MSFIRPLKKFVRVLAPDLFFQLKRLRLRRRFRVGHGGAEHRAKTALVGRYGQQVISGPFRCMRYGDDVLCSAYVAKLVGSYEAELHPVIERIVARGYRVVVDVGSAEGYYAVGLALRLPAARVFAFDIDPDAQRFCPDLARRNEVADRVVMGGLCDHAALERLCGPGALVVCDCEGFEGELLDPSRVPALAATDILVELHEHLHAGLNAEVLARFSATHTVTLVPTAERDPRDYPELEVVAAPDRAWAVREGRAVAMHWAFFECRKAPSPL